MARRRVLALAVLVVMVVVITAAVVIALFTLPLGTKSESGQVSSAGPASAGACGASCYFGYVTEDVPAGASTTVTWQDTSGTWVVFTVFELSNPSSGGCSQQGTSGSCGFTSGGGTYTIALSDSSSSGTTVVTFTVSYPAPIL